MSNYEDWRERELIYQAELMGSVVDWEWWGSRDPDQLSPDFVRWTCEWYYPHEAAAGDTHTSHFTMWDGVCIAVHNWDNTNPWWHESTKGDQSD